MRAYDFSPLYRATVGFDRVADLMDRVLSNEMPQSSYPPYNIEKTDADSYRISIAVAGFSENDLSVEQRENALIVSAKRAEEEDGEKTRTFLHRGIATRAFEKHFHLADHVRVTGASHVNGMLHIDLMREMPEALKPRKIEISKTNTVNAVDTKAIEA